MTLTLIDLTKERPYEYLTSSQVPRVNEWIDIKYRDKSLSFLISSVRYTVDTTQDYYLRVELRGHYYDK